MGPMNKRPGHVNVTTEAGFCNFCGRPRNLRSEEHQLGTFVRTVVTCETCHRTLSSTMGVAGAEPKVTEDAETVEKAPAATPPAKPQPAKRAAAAKSGAAPAQPKATKARSTKTK
jgi:hypothetical protein